jgi:hypothetical protein
VSWALLLSIYAGWLAAFGILWGAFVWFMRWQGAPAKPKAPEVPKAVVPASATPAPKPIAPAAVPAPAPKPAPVPVPAPKPAVPAPVAKPVPLPTIKPPMPAFVPSAPKPQPMPVSTPLAPEKKLEAKLPKKFGRMEVHPNHSLLPMIAELDLPAPKLQLPPHVSESKPPAHQQSFIDRLKAWLFSAPASFAAVAKPAAPVVVKPTPVAPTPKPVAVVPAPAPESKAVVLPPKPMPASTPVPTPPAPVFVSKFVPPPAPVSAAPTPAVPPAPVPAVPEVKMTDLDEGLPGIRVMPKRPEDIEKSNRASAVKFEEDK